MRRWRGWRSVQPPILHIAMLKMLTIFVGLGSGYLGEPRVILSPMPFLASLLRNRVTREFVGLGIHLECKHLAKRRIRTSCLDLRLVTTTRFYLSGGRGD